MKAYWYQGNWTQECGNVGDLLTPLIIKYITGQYPEPAKKDDKGKLLAVGSIVEFVQDNDVIWGGGLIKPMDLPPRKNVTVLAVRGRETAKILREQGYIVPEVYGDPAILMPLFYNPEIEKKHSIGFIPHYVETDEYKKVYSGHYIDIINSPLNFIDQMLECEEIITSSLHAYILALAYGVPAIYRQMTNKIIGGYFKYTDFSTGTSSPKALLNSFKEYYR